MGHYLHIFSLVKVPQGLSWRQIVWKQFPLLSPPHTPKNLNDRSGSLRGEPLYIIIQLLISTSRSWLSPSRNISHALQIMLLVHREAAKEHELVHPQPSACLSYFCWLVETVSRPPSLQFSSSASLTALMCAFVSPSPSEESEITGFSWSAPRRVPNPSKLFRHHPLLAGWVFLLEGQDWNFSCSSLT